jgi:hypothetical protein
LRRKTQRLEDTAFLERVGDLLLPTSTELFHTAVELFTELAVELPRGLVPGRRSSNGRAQVPKRDLLELGDCCLGAVKPDCLLHRRSDLFG